MSADELFVLGFILATVGLCMIAVTRMRMFHVSMAIRRALVEQATLHGDTARAAKWSAELRAWEGRFPKYALGFVCVGLTITALAAIRLLCSARSI